MAGKKLSAFEAFSEYRRVEAFAKAARVPYYQPMDLRFTTALVLGAMDLGENDRLATFMTPQDGVIRGVARGGQSTRSSFAGTMFPLNRVELAYETRRSSDLVSIDSCRVLESGVPFFQTFPMAMTAHAFLEMYQAFTRDLTQPGEASTFARLAQRWLSALAAHPAQAKVLLCYVQGWLLKLEGFLPSLYRCSQCSASLKDGSAAWFGRLQELSCGRCARNKKIEPDLRLGKETLRLIRGPLFRSAPEVFAAKKHSARALGEASRFFRYFLHSALGGPLRTEQVYREVRGLL